MGSARKTKMPRTRLQRTNNIGPGFSLHMRESPAGSMSTPHVDAIGRALYFAARGGDLARVHEALVNGSHNGSHFNWKNQAKSGQTALMAAAGGGHDQCVELILEAGATAVQEDNLGNTALHHAAWAGELACLDKLLEHRPTTGNSDVHWRNGAGQTALICAAQFGSTGVVSRLLEVGAAVDVRDNDGNTSVHYAAADNHLELVQLLLELGARGDFVNTDGLTALDLARYNGHEEMAEFLDQNV